VQAEIGGRPVRLKLTMEALARFEEVAPPGRSGARAFRALAWALASCDCPAWQIVDVGRLIGMEGLPGVAAAIAEAVRIGFGEAPTDGAPADRGKLDWWLVWSFARHDLGLSDAEFWDLTPRQFGAIAERHSAAYERDLARSALICATLANIHRDPDKKPEPFLPADFMPRLRQAGEDQEAKLANVKRLRAKAEQLNAMLGGRVKG
jgi:hypothetical protein